jgi:hypothetical protein
MIETLVNFSGFVWGNGVPQEEGMPIEGKIEAVRNMGRIKGHFGKPAGWPLISPSSWNLSIDSANGHRTPDDERNCQIWNVQDDDNHNGNLSFNGQILDE